MKSEYDEMVLVAANRQIVRLKDGRYGRLVYWQPSEEGDAATVLIGNRHVKIRHDEIMRDEGEYDD